MLNQKTQKWIDEVAETSFTKTAEAAYFDIVRGEDTEENRTAIWQSGYWSAQALQNIGFDVRWKEALVAESKLPDSGLWQHVSYLSGVGKLG